MCQVSWKKRRDVFIQVNMVKRLTIPRADHKCCSPVHIKVLREVRRWEYNSDELGYKKKKKKNQQEFALKSAQEERVRGWEQQALAQRLALWRREPLWAEQFVEGQRMIAYELTDITGLIKTKGHWHTRASPLWRSVSCWLKELTVWVDSSLFMTWPLVEDARPIKKHACAH